MKNKKYLKILIIVVLISFLLVSILLEFSPPVKEERGRGLEGQIVPKALSNLSNRNIKVSLIIQEKKYEIEIKDGATVFEVMQKMQKENSKNDLFDFKYTEHTGLGIFINEINGLKGSGGYWIYYVNGMEANVGVSNYKIKNGDIISWKYEK